MTYKRKKWPIVLGATLCVLALALCAALQYAGYLTYLDSDMASELILAKRQADTHSLFQMDWLYSTEVHLLQTNILYAFAFLFTGSFQMARIMGNMLGMVLAMAALVYLCRTLGLSWGRALATASLLPLTASPMYANAVSISGHYLFFVGFGFLGAALWLRTMKAEKKRRLILRTILFAAFCLLEGFLSVRYVLCFICPMAAVALMEFLLAPGEGSALRDDSMHFAVATAIGFAGCVLGYAASEIILPRLFHSGVGAASSFLFNPLDGQAIQNTLLTVCTDFLKLLGWRGGVSLFSLAGIVNVSVAGVLFFGAVMTVRVFKSLNKQDKTQRGQRRIMTYAGYAFLINLFCYLFVQGTYLNRYLVLAVIFLLPVLAIVLRREKNVRLRTMFLLLLCVQMGGSTLLMQKDTWQQKDAAEARGADMMDAAAFLQDEGYTHGYGTFWNVRVMQERTQGKLTMTGVVPAETEEGAASPVSLDVIRWLEPDEYSDLDICMGKTFLILTEEEEKKAAPWLTMTGAPRIYQNDTYRIYGFESSQALNSSMLWGKMKLEGATFENGVFTLHAGGKMRVPTSWREKGAYMLEFSCQGDADGVVQIYTGSDFELLAEKPIAAGENALHFELETDDKYNMIVFRGGEEEIRLSNLSLRKVN